ncbi:MAG: ribose 5-phosphate isomerase B [bacterium]|nr:ribose 5-phosphate isomerase B [bacterium]
MKIALGSDHAGFELKEEVKGYLSKAGYEVGDLGTYTSFPHCDYPDFGYEVARGVSSEKYNFGILICGTGIGMSIVANKVPGIRASLCYNIEAAKLSRQHNDSNILVMGARFVDKSSALQMVKIFLETQAEGGRHLRRVSKIKEIEKKILKIC